MKSWTNYLIDDAPIRHIFGQETPSLCQVRIHEVCLLQDGPEVSISLDLASYPVDPPKKWNMMGYNTVQLIISAIIVEDLKVTGWKKDNVIDFNVEAVGDSVQIRGGNEDVEIYLISRFLGLKKISAYKKVSNFSGL